MVSLRGSPLRRAGLLVLLCALAPTGCRQLVGYGNAAPDVGRPDVGAVGAVGLPCYANQTCNVGLLCAAGRCFVPDLPLPPDRGPDGPADAALPDLARDASGPSFLAQACDAQVAPTSPGLVSTWVGGPSAGAEDGPLSSARLRVPVALAQDHSGVLIADRDNHRIRKLACGSVWTFAGSGVAGYQNGPVESARFNAPSALAVGADGTVFVADSGNRRIRRITQSLVSTYAGSGATGSSGGSAATASFTSPRGLAWHEATATLYVADYGAGMIRAIKAGQVSVVSSKLGGPVALAWRSDGALLVSEYDAHRILAIDLTTMNTELLAGDGIAGLTDGLATAARLRQPAGLVVTSDDKLWIADSGNHALRVLDGGQLSTIVGAAGLPGNDDGSFATARLLAPYALLAVQDGLLVADSAAHRLRRVTTPQP